MKILILSNHALGLYRFRKELILSLLIEHEVLVSLPEGDFIPYLKDMGCNFLKTEFDRHGMNPFSDLKLLIQYICMIRKQRPDFILTYTIKPNIYGGIAARLCRVPYVANITGLGSAMEKESKLQKMLLLLYKTALSGAQTVFFQNQDNMDFFLNHKISPGNQKLLPGSGVNLEEYQPLEFPDSEFVAFAFIARVMKEKGIEQYLEAAKVIKNKYPKTQFHVYGACEEDYHDLLTSLEEKKVIHYHGVAQNMSEIYGQMQCIILPTYYPEGMNNVLLESAASARPVITTDRSGCKEIVEDGLNGFICKDRDSKDLINQIERFLSLDINERKQMGVNGRKKVEQEFDRRIVVEAYRREIEL